MEGVLLKWTNYWNGWQTRWFVLHDGILSYYRSAEDVNQGCKGSVKVSAIQIAVSNVDSTRMDLSIPGQKNLYLKAPSPQERQLWLVALGSAKACVTLTTEMKNSALTVHHKSVLAIWQQRQRNYERTVIY
uniref:Pleckstrin homology domain-containing family A member 3 n=1 Tax=Lygus hesperus TaxID=30085 RepID=A0A0A9X0H2_LYGHE